MLALLCGLASGLMFFRAIDGRAEVIGFVGAVCVAVLAACFYGLYQRSKMCVLSVFVKPFYLAMSGKPSALPLFDSMEILGRDITRDRINHAIATLGGLGKKKLKKLDKELAALAVLAESE